MMRRAAFIVLLGVLVAFIGCDKQPDQITVTMYQISNEGVGESIGTLTVTATRYGAIFTPNLSGLTPGFHGFHVHENPDCAPAEKNGKMTAGVSAGGHYDPANTGKHEGPYGVGHLGDLPKLYVDAAGKATYSVIAPRIQLSDIKGRALVIHAGGDNYSDEPEKLGGGGARVACGTIP